MSFEPLVSDPPAADPVQPGRLGWSRKVLLGTVAAVVLFAAAWAVDPTSGKRSADAAERVAAPTREHASDHVAEMAPLPEARPKLVQPVAGQSVTQTTAEQPVARPEAKADPKVTGPASSSTRADVDGELGVSGLSSTEATALPNGVALPPLEAPQAVLDVIRAGNIIAKSPYKWGGGHGNFQDSGYDCSGSVTYALYYAGLISRSATSGELMSYGEPGPGKWISIYSNPGHVYMMVAGVRFDTVARKLTGSRWQNSPVSAPGRYVVRHPPGL